MKKRILLVHFLILLIFSALSAGPQKGKIQLEIFGGISFMDPADLNAYPEVWEQYFNFDHKDRYDYYIRAGYIQSYDFDRVGEFETIKSAFPLGLRIRWNVFKFLSFSLGFKYISANASSHVDHTVEILGNDGVKSNDIFIFSPLVISAGGWVPLLGIHLEKKLNSRTGLEIYISGGPFNGKCEYNYAYEFEHWDDGILTSSSSRFVQEKGKGQGVSLGAFLRLNHSLGKHLGFFFETGYVYQKVDHLEGPGVLNEDGIVEEWEGEWGMKEDYNANYWGQVDLIYPSNSWEYPQKKLWVRYFKLDLYCFQVRIGFSFRF